MDSQTDRVAPAARHAQTGRGGAAGRDPRSILLCIRTAYGGIFRHVFDLAEQLCRRGIAVGMVVGRDVPIPSGISDDRVRASAPLGIWRLPIARALGPHDLVNVAKIARIARRLDVDIIHGHGAKGGAYARLTGRILGKPSIYSPHGGSTHFSGDRLKGRAVLGLERMLLGISGGVVFDTRASLDVFTAKIGPPRCHSAIIPNGLCEADFEPPDPTRQRYDFAFLGRIIEMKGVDVLLQAALRIQESGRSCRIGIFGSGSDLEKFRALAESLSLRNVEWCGWAEKTRDALEAGRCLVVPSRFDSMPYTVIEGAAMGVPIIASGVGGIPEILGPDHPVLPPGDDQALASRMIAFLDDPASAAEPARRLRQDAVQRFRIDIMLERILALYRMTLARAENAH